MKLQINLKIRYPDSAKTEARPYGTSNIEDNYEQTIEIESETDAREIVNRVIRAFNNFQ